jgi:hypothetical protein
MASSDLVAARYRIDAADNLLARKVQTQFQLFHRIVVVVVMIVALAVMLMTFPAIRSIGTSLLASAGLAGLIVGIAMLPTLASLVAGIQIALTQPIRIEDSVVVEGEWGGSRRSAQLTWLYEFGIYDAWWSLCPTLSSILFRIGHEPTLTFLRLFCFGLTTQSPSKSCARNFAGLWNRLTAGKAAFASFRSPTRVTTLFNSAH